MPQKRGLAIGVPEEDPPMLQEGDERFRDHFLGAKTKRFPCPSMKLSVIVPALLTKYF